MEVFKPQTLITLAWIAAGILLVTIVLILIFKFLNKDKALQVLEKYLQNKKYQKALEIANSYLKEHPDDFVILDYMGQAYEGLKNYAQAINFYERASVVAEKEVQTALQIKILHKIGILYKKNKMLKDALGYFALVLDKYPKNSKTLYEAADTLILMQNYKKAREYLSLLIKIKPDNLRAHYLYSKTLFQLGEFQSCAKQLASLLPNLPRGDRVSQNARLLLAESYIHLKKYKEAVGTLSSLLAVDSLFEQVLMKIISVLIMAEQYNEAINLAKKYLNRVSKKNRVSIFYQIGNAYFKKDSIYEALDMWRQASKIDPGYKDLREILQQYKILIDHSELKHFFTKTPNEFEQFVVPIIGSKTINQIKKENDFWVIMSSQALHIVYRKPFPVNSFVLEQVSKVVQGEALNTMNIFLYTVFGTDNSGKNHLFYKRLEEIKGVDLVNRIKQGQMNER